MLSLEPGLAERFDSALDCVRAVVYSSHRPLKAIAAEMDTSVSTLSRKLAAHPDDPRHFTLADLEQYGCRIGIGVVVAGLLSCLPDDSTAALTPRSPMVNEFVAGTSNIHAPLCVNTSSRIAGPPQQSCHR